MRVKLLWFTDPKIILSKLKERGLTISNAALREHVIYMFEIEDVSRVTTHQLIRHRLASYDQESQRFSAASKESFVIPYTISSNPEALELYNRITKLCAETFEKLVALGVPKEDARYIMPHSIKTKLVMTLSANSLMHIVELRMTQQAQWEIRELVSKMKELAANATPELWKE